MKIRTFREKIIANHTLLFDRPIELMPGQIDYLMNAGFAWDNKQETLFLKSGPIELKFLLTGVYENE